MYFDQIIGQEHSKKYLLKLIHENRVPHAFLLSGPEGSGKMALAIAFAQYLACHNPTENEVCGACPACKKYEKLEHPDLHFVYPVVTSSSVKKPVSRDYFPQWKAYVSESPYVSVQTWMQHLGSENKQPMIYAHESEAILKMLSMKPYESENQVMIIYLPERMNIACSNKLLKLVEEPPQKTIFILVTENADQILTTILSRCQIINVPKIHTDILTTKLQQQFEMDQDTAKSISRISNGNYTKALDMVHSNQEHAFYLEQFITLMRLAYKRDIYPLKKWSDEMHGIGRERQKNFLQYTVRLLRENFIMNLNTENLNYLTVEEQNFSVKFSRFINERNITQLFEEIEKAQRHVEQNVYAKMVFFDLALQVILLLKS